MSDLLVPASKYPPAARYQASQLHKAALYIEAQLAEPFNIQQLADASCYSYHRFRHLFAAATGESVGSFVQRTRLERGAYLLRHSALLGGDIAEAIGYASGAAFTKAFTKHFGRSPSACRTTSHRVFVTAARGLLSNYATPDVVLASSRTLLWARGHGPDRHEAAWAALDQGTPPGVPAARFGKTPDFPGITAPDRLRYDVGLELPGGAAGLVAPDPGLYVQTMPGGKFAVLRYDGPAWLLADAFELIYQNWLPESGYCLRNANWYQRYPGAEEAQPMEIFIPIL